MNEAEAFLAHYGVKGMKWGVRRSEALASRSMPSTVKTKVQPALRGSQTVKVRNKAGGKVTTKGGKRNVASDDAVKVAVSLQKAKVNKTSVLSNKELQDAVNRLNLEKQYVKLAKENAKRTRGQRFVSAVLNVAGDALASEVKNGLNVEPNKK